MEVFAWADLVTVDAKLRGQPGDENVVPLRGVGPFTPVAAQPIKKKTKDLSAMTAKDNFEAADLIVGELRETSEEDRATRLKQLREANPLMYMLVEHRLKKALTRS